MAWQYPKHACGHTGERYQAYGRLDERERQLAALERHECPACRKAAADKASVDVGLPLLVGSDKQVVWATEIRERVLRLHPELAQQLRAETSARWWIERAGAKVAWLREVTLNKCAHCGVTVEIKNV